MASSPLTLTPYRSPRPRAASVRLPAVGQCIYCGKTAPEYSLSDEHIIPDGLGGDLILPASSCHDCAVATSRAERHLLKEVLQFARHVVDVRSRKRKTARGKINAQLEGSNEEVEVPLDNNTPFLLPFILSDHLPRILTGAPDCDAEPALRLGLFGPKNWNERGKEWLGGTGSFKWGYSFHPGVAGQALAKIGHSYATAVLGTNAFKPLLSNYILATEPPFDGRHIGVFSSDSGDEALHYLDLQVVNAPCTTAIGVGLTPLYVVYLRLFAFQPSPSILMAVGRPVGGVAPGLRTMSLGTIH